MNIITKHVCFLILLLKMFVFAMVRKLLAAVTLIDFGRSIHHASWKTWFFCDYYRKRWRTLYNIFLAITEWMKRRSLFDHLTYDQENGQKQHHQITTKIFTKYFLFENFFVLQHFFNQFCIIPIIAVGTLLNMKSLWTTYGSFENLLKYVSTYSYLV